MSNVLKRLNRLIKYLKSNNLGSESSYLEKCASDFEDDDFSKAFIGKKQLEAQKVFNENKDPSFFSNFLYIYPSDKGNMAAMAFLKNSPSHPIKTYAKYNEDSLNICSIFDKVTDAQMFFVVRGTPQYALYGSAEGSKAQRATAEEIKSVVSDGILKSLRQDVGEHEIPVVLPKDINITDNIFFDKDSFDGTKTLKSGLEDFHEVMLTGSQIIGILFNDSSSKLAHDLYNLKPTISLFYCRNGIIYSDEIAQEMLVKKYSEVDYDVISGEIDRGLSREARLRMEQGDLDELNKIVQKFIEDSDGLKLGSYTEFLSKIDDNPYFSSYKMFEELNHYKKDISEQLLLNFLESSTNYYIIDWEPFDKEFCKKYIYEEDFVLSAVKKTFDSFYSKLASILKEKKVDELPYNLSPFVSFLEQMKSCLKGKYKEGEDSLFVSLYNSLVAQIDSVFLDIISEGLVDKYNEVVNKESEPGFQAYYYFDDLYNSFLNIK